MTPKPHRIQCTKTQVATLLLPSETVAWIGETSNWANAYAAGDPAQNER
jgi:hypothetical protein